MRHSVEGRLDITGSLTTLTRRLVLVLTVVSVVVAGCGGDGSGDPDAFGPTIERRYEPFVIATGKDGIAITNGDWFELVEPDPYGRVESVALLPDGSAVADAGRRLLLLRPHQPAVSYPCDRGCGGVAVVGERIVTTRSNGRPDGFEIVFLDFSFTEVGAVPATRLPAPYGNNPDGDAGYPPRVLAASSDRITVSHLTHDGGGRAGPSVISQYTHSGELIESTIVDGTIDWPTPSPDGDYLAFTLGGSGGACVTVMELALLELDSLDLVDLGSPAPAFHHSDAWSWSMVTELHWQDGKVVATSLFFEPPAGSSCDENPIVWRRTVDPVTAEVIDREETYIASQWIGPGCDDLLAIASSDPTWHDPRLIRRVGDEEVVLGKFRNLYLVSEGPRDC